VSICRMRVSRGLDMAFAVFVKERKEDPNLSLGLAVGGAWHRDNYQFFHGSSP
jgi:hypothetical protein